MSFKSSVNRKIQAQSGNQRKILRIFSKKSTDLGLFRGDARRILLRDGGDQFIDAFLVGIGLHLEKQKKTQDKQPHQKK